MLGTRLFPLTPIQDRSIGVILSAFCADALGAPVEGLSAQDIIRFTKKDGEPPLKDMKLGYHMGAHHCGLRIGMYTDDSNALLALASSLVEKKTLDPRHCAYQYAHFWKTPPERGCPDSAQQIMQNVLNGIDYRLTGRMVFPDGSYANGGAMRIGPVGVAFRNAEEDVLYEAVRQAIISTHVHPQAVDAAFLVAKTISMFLKMEPDQVRPERLLLELHSKSRDEEMKKKLWKLISRLRLEKEGKVEQEEEAFLLEVGGTFQIRATQAVACALWAVVKCWDDPEGCIIKAVNMGGDTDTLGCIAGAMIGALHGCQWIPIRWWDKLENNERGRDWAVSIAKHLSDLDLRSPLQPPL
eukprot:TRINITY_DN2658_c0_g4_i3.p1 TRINITY_DN2658_c0_g4~~TRINITY_DN2658_c0_g4_i3.p1  ORF type:complete len:354 (-),score=72.55 TRINITY_DN2658_c0_g4_i3:366-1427(-)